MYQKEADFMVTSNVLQLNSNKSEQTFTNVSLYITIEANTEISDSSDSGPTSTVD